ncbi:MAG: DUF1648 domain-containing protein [Betaproteobacteria bacterium]
MRRISFAVFVLLLIAAAAFIVTTSAELPDRVASHFGGGGRANGWMTREFYIWFMLGFGVLLPLVIVASMTLMPGLINRSVDLSQRGRRDQIVRRDVAIASIADVAPWIGAVICGFIAGLHYAILDANASNPPRLSADLFIALMVAFLGAIAVLIVTLTIRARRAA